MKAILLAAGEGTRFKPVTDLIPKPLLPIVDTCLIDMNLRRLFSAGATCVGINLFHKHKVIEHHLRKYARRVNPMIENVLKGTGGALLNFKDFVGSDFLIQSADVVSDINYKEIIGIHKKHDPVATLVMVHHQGTKFRIDKDNRIDRILGYDTTPYTYAGIGVLSSRIFSFLPDKPVFSFVEVLTNLIRKKEPILGIPAVIHWYNINSFYEYWKIHGDLLQGRITMENLNYPSPIYIAPSSRIETNELHGFVSVAGNCRLTRNVYLENTVVLPGTSLNAGHYRNCVISNSIRIAVA